MSITFSPSFVQGLAPLIQDPSLQQALFKRFNPEDALVELYMLTNHLQHGLRKNGQFSQAEKVRSYISPIIQEIRLQTPPTVTGNKRFAPIDYEPYQRFCPCTHIKEPDSSMEEDEKPSKSTNEIAIYAAIEKIFFSRSTSQAPAAIFENIIPGDWEQLPPKEINRRALALKDNPESAETLDRFGFFRFPPREIIRKIETIVRNLGTDFCSTQLPCTPGNISEHPDLVTKIFNSIYLQKINAILWTLTGSDSAVAIERALIHERINHGISNAAHLTSSLIHEKIPTLLAELPPELHFNISALLNEINMPRI